MSIIVKTANASGLLKKITEGIQKKHVTTWMEKDGYLTHDTDQWRYKGWFLPRVYSDSLVFYIRPPKGGVVTSTAYAIYHGRLSEMLLAHFDSEFTEATSSAMPDTDGDIIKSKTAK